MGRVQMGRASCRRKTMDPGSVGAAAGLGCLLIIGIILCVRDRCETPHPTSRFVPYVPPPRWSLRDTLLPLVGRS